MENIRETTVKLRIWQTLAVLFKLQVVGMVIAIACSNELLFLIFQGTTIITAILGWFSRPDEEKGTQETQQKQGSNV